MTAVTPAPSNNEALIARLSDPTSRELNPEAASALEVQAAKVTELEGQIAKLTADLATARRDTLLEAASTMPLYLRGTYLGDVDSDDAHQWLIARSATPEEPTA